MSSKMPPIPPANRSPKGPGGATHASPDAGAKEDTIPDHADDTGQAANTTINTTNQGHQQDR